MNELPAIRKLSRKDAYHSLALQPLEWITRSLRKGDPWELGELQEFARRCRALADAYDMRVEAANQGNDQLNLTKTTD